MVHTENFFAGDVVICKVSGKGITQSSKQITGVTITYYTGTTQNFSVESNGKLYFENEALYLKSNSTTEATVIPISIIQKITFSNTLGVTTFGQNENNLTLYPNPASDLIKIGANSNDVMEVLAFKVSDTSPVLALSWQDLQFKQPIHRP